MAKQIIRLTESDLHRLVKESVKRILRECGDVDGMIEDGIDEEGFDGAGNAGNSGQYLAGSGIVGDPEFWGDTKKRKNVTNMGETDPRK